LSERFVISGKAFGLPGAMKNWKLTRRPGGWILAEGPGGSRVRFAAEERGGRLSALLEGKLLHGELKSESRAADSAGGSDSDLTAQFPGKIRKILVTEGQAVKAREPLLLVEAMKMEFTVRAPFDGKVADIRVKEGEQIAPGTRFLEVRRGG
jgi:acetyl/propionyl-CoA carboxylase alpha subunit